MKKWFNVLVTITNLMVISAININAMESKDLKKELDDLKSMVGNIIE